MRNSVPRTALLYAVLTGLWIFAVDLLVDMLVSDPYSFAGLHLALAILTVLLLYFLLSRELWAREQANARRRASEQRLSSLLDTAVDAVIAIGDDTRVFVFNQGAQRIFGYQPQEVLGQPLELLV